MIDDDLYNKGRISKKTSKQSWFLYLILFDKYTKLRIIMRIYPNKCQATKSNDDDQQTRQGRFASRYVLPHDFGGSNIGRARSRLRRLQVFRFFLLCWSFRHT